MSSSDVNPVHVNLWKSTEHALEYLRRADSIPHRVEGEATLLECLPQRVDRFLDLGSGAGRLLSLVKTARPSAAAVAVDFSPSMLERLREQFSADSSVKVIEHNLDSPLPGLGSFDLVVSSFAIHHVPHERKRALYGEIFNLLLPAGVFCNLEHVASPSLALHHEFLDRLEIKRNEEDPSNKLIALETQLDWLRDLGFEDVDCLWKWRELALLFGRKPTE